MKGDGIARRISARAGSPWRRNPEAVRLARQLRRVAVAKAREAHENEKLLQAALAAERMHRRH